MPRCQSPEEWLDSPPRSDDPNIGGAGTARAWVLQTFLELRAAGYSWRFSTERPREGIVISMSDYRPPDGGSWADVFYCVVVADSPGSRHAHFSIVSNRRQVTRPHCQAFVPHWPERGLVGRSKTRGTQFKTVRYYGDPANLSEDLRGPAWRDRLRSNLGLDFQLMPPDRWWDYSETDCALAIRSFDGNPFLHKPASKLYNAWLAGCVFIGGADAAFADEGRPGRDFLQAFHRDEAFAHLKMLAANPDLRLRLVEEGTHASEAVSRGAVCLRWAELIQGRLLPMAIQREGASRARRVLDAFRREPAATVRRWLGHLRRQR